MIPYLTETGLAYKTETVTENVFCVFDCRACSCKQHVHIKKIWHEEEEQQKEMEADRNFTQLMGPIWHTNQKNNQLPLLAFLQQMGRILTLKDTFTFIIIQCQVSFHRNFLPEHVNPSPVNPSAQAQRYDPGVFTH